MREKKTKGQGLLERERIKESLTCGTHIQVIGFMVDCVYTFLARDATWANKWTRRLRWWLGGAEMANEVACHINRERN